MSLLSPSVPAIADDSFTGSLRAFGCTDVVDLSPKDARPEQLEYLDLMPRRGKPLPLPVPIAAVAEHQGTALLYIVDGRALPSGKEEVTLKQLQHELANRSDPAYLGVVTGGSLDIYPIEFHPAKTKTKPLRKLHTVQQDEIHAPLLFQNMVHGNFGAQHKEPHASDYVYQQIMKLLDGTTAEFGGDPAHEVPGKLPPLEVLSMAGRALFFRFLVDRGVVVEDERQEICPSAGEMKAAFATPAAAAETASWLDQTFNGDFLPLFDEDTLRIPSDDRPARQAAYATYFAEVQRSAAGNIFAHLDAILRGWESRDGTHIQPEFDFIVDWSDLNFAHIPIGVLSQVYENFSHRADGEFAKSTSVHYTPRLIARFVVEEAFASLNEPDTAKVLDPSCGAGIFLVLTLRRLVQERWLRDGQRPNAETVRQILYKQVRGFDISESALRLAALGLYITAIEMNGSPRPPKSLKFPRDLRGSVLFNFNEYADQPGRVPLGSLGPHVPSQEFDGQFQLVIGNPPWTALKAPTPVSTTAKAAQKTKLRAEGKMVEPEETTKLNFYFTGLASRVLKQKATLASEANRPALAAELTELAAEYQNPRKNPDLPFLWRAAEWAAPGAIIALVLPARLYLLGPKTTTPSKGEESDIEETDGTDHTAWRSVLQSMALTGLINGSDLRKTAVWRGVDVPWSMFFARNELPPDRHAFRFASPGYEPGHNQRGLFRLDYQNDVLVTCAEVLAKPWLLKALALGNMLDVSLVEKIKSAQKQTLGEFWMGWDDTGGDRTGQGYNLSPGLKQKPATFLADLLVFERPYNFTIEWGQLRTFRESHDRDTAYRPKTEHLYKAPLVIVPKSPHEAHRSPKGFFAGREIAFSQINYGYSCAGHPSPNLLASLIYLISNSDILLYWILMTCPSFGTDRQMFLKGVLDSIPFPAIESLPPEEEQKITTLAQRLQNEANKPWDEINDLFTRLYGLSKEECELMEDTLFSAAPYRAAGAAAFHPAIPEDIAVFTDALAAALQPWLEISGRTVIVRPAGFEQNPDQDSWYFIEVTTRNEHVTVTSDLVAAAIATANEYGCSRVVVRGTGPQSGLLLGQIAQRRWWTRTRARLCATHLFHNHLDALRPPRRSK
jgi:hypothetical protein